MILTNLVAENRLSFIETSALDASNVESAFQNILTSMFISPYTAGTLCAMKRSALTRFAEIYDIVSSKILSNSAEIIKPSFGAPIDVARTENDGGAKEGSKCCA